MLICLAGGVIVDLLVQQIYPVPPELWGKAPMREILATRPDAAVALNIGGQLLVLAPVAFMTSRYARSGTMRPGALVTGVILVFGVLNALLTDNFRWLTAAAIPLVLCVGLGAAKRGSRASE